VNRTDIINSLILSNNLKTYLEIGVRNRDDNFNKIACYDKTGVDPEPSANATYVMTSDDFFKFNKKKFDIIFIDGLHLREQVLKDIENSLNTLNDEGFIVCHDCLPNTEKEQIEYYDGISAWVGTVWKGISYLRMTRKDLEIKVVDTDYGCGIIKKGSQNLYPKIEFADMDWNYFSKNRNDLMNVISVEEFKKYYVL
jgi:hypothetical protein